MLRVAKSGGRPLAIATTKSVAVGVAVDERAVYDSLEEGSVFKQAK